MMVMNNVFVRNGQYVYMDKDTERPATSWEITHAIGEAVQTNNFKKFTELTCACGLDFRNCCSEVCLNGQFDDVA